MALSLSFKFYNAVFFISTKHLYFEPARGKFNLKIPFIFPTISLNVHQRRVRMALSLSTLYIKEESLFGASKG